MASPTKTNTGSGSNKQTINSTVTVTASATVAVNNIVEVVCATDPNAGVTNCVSAGGTAVFSTFVVSLDVTNGTTTTGSRLVIIRMVCTTAGTMTGVTVTAGTTGPRAVEVAVISGADPAAPVMVTSNTNSVTTTAGRDVIATSAVAIENTGASAVTSSKSGTDAANWTAGAADTTSVGTTGTPTTGNISVAQSTWTRLATVAASVTLDTNAATGTLAKGIVVYQAAAAAGTIGKVLVSGTPVVAAQKDMVSGSIVTATQKVRVSGTVV